MSSVLGALDPQELVVLVVALLGIIPVVLYYRTISQWFVVAYGFLVVAAFATNVENLVLPDLLNFVEHFVGNMGAGIAFAVAAYIYRKERIGFDDEGATSEA